MTSNAAAGGRIRGLYAIADTSYLGDTDLVPAVTQAIAGGARVIQYRDKKGAASTRLRQAGELARLCRRHAVPFLVNDDVELTADAPADGVHLGKSDSPVDAARRRLGAEAIIGVSCYNDLTRALAAAAGGADYVAFGSFFPSRTKPLAPRATVELLRTARRRLQLPLVAIGGITPENGAALLEAGADALAAIEGVFGQADIRAATERYARLFNNGQD
jgi:thiamine-phosphate pyrophosphorylase